MKRQPNPGTDHVSTRSLISEWVHEKPDRVIASRMAILGILLWVFLIALGLVAIWTDPDPIGNRLGNTAALLAIPAFGFTAGGFVWRSC